MQKKQREENRRAEDGGKRREAAWNGRTYTANDGVMAREMGLAALAAEDLVGI